MGWRGLQRRVPGARRRTWGAVWAAPLGLLPGRYGGETAEAGPVWVEVAPSGALEVTVAGRAYPLLPEAVQVRVSAEGPCLQARPAAGLPAGLAEVCLQPVADPLRAAAPSVRPAAWIGRWRHQATGGAVTLHLHADGTFVLESNTPRAPAASTDPNAALGPRSHWHTEGQTLVITRPGGTTVRYQVRLEAGAAGPGLALSGGDLPFEIVFAAETPSRDPGVEPEVP